MGEHSKMVAAKNWSFELFYWDLTIGLFLTAALAAVTLGSMGSEGQTFSKILRQWIGIALNMLF